MIESLRNRQFPHPDELIDWLEGFFPWIGEMEDTPQDPEWHGEGSVRIHTGMVIAEMVELIQSGDEFTDDEVVGLILAAALHEIGKVVATREEEIGGRLRIVSPHHADRGRSYVAPRIGPLGLSEEERRTVLGLIRFHHEPRKLVMGRSPGRHHFMRLARGIEAHLLYWFEQADIRGRIARDRKEQLEIVELFRAGAEGYETWLRADPYRQWSEFFESEIEDTREREYACSEGIRQFELGLIRSPEEALAKTWRHRKAHPRLTVVSGPSGSGKSSWIQKHGDADTLVISLDSIREEITEKRGDQSRNGQVMQLGKERLKQALRERRNIAWDTTALRRDNRSMVLGLGHDYHAWTRLVVIGVPPAIASRRNRKREDPIPQSAIDRQFRLWQWPDVWEAHGVEECFLGE